MILAAWIVPSSFAAATSCSSPTLGTRNNLVKQKAVIEVTGYAWLDGTCEGPDSRGCGASDPPPPALPMEDIELSLRPIEGGPEIPLATTDANAEGDFSVEIELPRVPDGEYVLIGRTGDEVIEGDPVTITKDGGHGDP